MPRSWSTYAIARSQQTLLSIPATKLQLPELLPLVLQECCTFYRGLNSQFCIPNTTPIQDMQGLWRLVVLWGFKPVSLFFSSSMYLHTFLAYILVCPYPCLVWRWSSYAIARFWWQQWQRPVSVSPPMSLPQFLYTACSWHMTNHALWPTKRLPASNC